MKFSNTLSPLFFIVSFFCSISIVAQKSPVKAGDGYFKEFKYYEAAEQYRAALEDDDEDYYARYQLAEAYRNYFDYKSAEKEYGEVADNALESYPEALFWHAEMLKLNAKYDEAEERFSEFIAMNYRGDNAEELNSKAAIEKEGCEMAKVELKRPVRDYDFKILPSSLNSNTTDFAPAIYLNDSTFYFTSTRSSGVDEEEDELRTEFSNQYLAKGNNLKWTVEPIDELTTKFNESAGSFTIDKQKYYFTRCDEKSTSGKYKDFLCAIYVTKREGDAWGEQIRLNDHINSKGQWNAQPSITSSGDTLFFVSKRKGGKGMHDIWYSVKTGGDEDWGKAINLENVNTPYIDYSPSYYGSDHVLFFASNGREGFGGLDSYKAHGENFSEIENLGLPFNSNKDDFYFVLGDSVGYLVSNREGGIGGDDIYKFNKTSVKEALIGETHSSSDSGSVTISGTIVALNDTTNVEDFVEVLTDGDGERLKTTKSDEQGDFKFDNLPAGDYQIYVEQQGTPDLVHESQVVIEDLKFDVSTAAASKVLFENIYFDYDKSELRPEAIKVLEELVVYYKEHPNVQIEMNSYTDSRGSDEYNVWLSQLRGKAAYKFLINHGVKKTGIVITAKGKDAPIASNDNPVGRQLNRRIEFSIVGGGDRASETMTYIIEPKQTLYLIAGRFGMTVDELKSLNGLDNEDILAYRPLRVRNSNDMDLIDPTSMQQGSVKRNKKYYKKQSKRINAYQESYENHVVELSKEDVKAGYGVYTVRKKNTLFSISRLFGMKVDELKRMNLLEQDLIYPGYQLKVMHYRGDVPEGFYVFTKKDNIEKVCDKAGLTLEEFQAVNMSEGYTIQEGMLIKIQ